MGTLEQNVLSSTVFSLAIFMFYWHGTMVGQLMVLVVCYCNKDKYLLVYHLIIFVWLAKCLITQLIGLF